jgi:hypothetical protein
MGSSRIKRRIAHLLALIVQPAMQQQEVELAKFKVAAAGCKLLCVFLRPSITQRHSEASAVRTHRQRVWGPIQKVGD